MVASFRVVYYLDLWIRNNLPFLYKTSEPIIASETIWVPLNFLLFHIWLGFKDSNPFPRDDLGLFAFDGAWCRLCLDVNWRFNCGNRALDTLVLPDLFVGCCRYEDRIIFLGPGCRLLFLHGWVSRSSGFIKFLYLCDLIWEPYIQHLFVLNPFAFIILRYFLQLTLIIVALQLIELG